MGIQQDREKLKMVYPSDRWIKKVDKMSDLQVVAILMRLKSQGKLK